MSVIKSITDLFKSKPLVDITVAGISHTRTGIKRFVPSLMDVYLHFDERLLLRCSSIEQYSRLRIALTEEIEEERDIPSDSEFCTCSLSKVLLKYPDEARYITSLKMVSNNRDELEDGVVACAGFDIQGEGFLFMDPMTLIGIQLGGSQRYNEWLEEFKGRWEQMAEYVWRWSSDEIEMTRMI